jgi:hypothetical protein
MLAIVLHLAIAATNPNPLTVAAGECVEVKLNGAANYDATADAFVGDGTLTPKGGDSLNVHWASILLGEKDGLYISSHTFTLGSDRFDTFDEISLTPTSSPSAFEFVNHVKIKTGTGRVNSGEILVFGNVDFATGVVQLHGGRGKVCNAR